MKKKHKLLILIIIASGFLPGSILIHGQTGSLEKDTDLEERMEWWNEARFGMFLHWGVYSVFGGEWDGVDHGKEMGEASAEWIYLRADIPEEAYKQAAANFNPVHYNPAEWVSMAKNAGMKYMVLTSKHHDGFAMFDTKASDWNIMKSSPYGKDIIKMYTDACHEQGMRVGLYFSHEKDWFHHKKIQKDTSELTDEYIRVTTTHLKELLTNYGQIDVIWFDMGISQHEEFNRMCYEMVRKYQPNCIISSRIGSNLGDYTNLRDRQLALPGFPGYVESIMTLRLNWGYDKNDSNWKSSDEVVSMISKCACRSSNFLLNMGPQPDGRFAPEEVIRLNNIGKWMDYSSDAIYGTSGSPFKGEYKWGSLSSKGKKVYLHLFNPHGGEINADGIKSKVRSAYLLQDGEKLKFEQNSEEAGLSIYLPDHAQEQLIPVVVLELESELIVDTLKGPTILPASIHHNNRIAVTGIVKQVNHTSFTILSEDGEHSFNFNEKIKYRENIKGRIIENQGFYLEKGKEYRIIYAPPSQSPHVEIITLIS